ncbi:MAG: hypothetical protein E7375_01545 [Clostridiales bacterium]|nr:hypothetical protein [Clostridiales bacterium]
MKTKKKEKKKQKGLLWFLGVSAASVMLLLGCQFFFESALTGDEKFYENTKINGIEVGGMSIAEAENIVLTDMLESRNEIEIELVSGEKSWILKGNDFEVSNKIQPLMNNLIKAERQGNFFQNLANANKIKEEGKEFQISYSNILGNMDSQIDEIVKKVEQESVAPKLVFQPKGDQTFVVDEGQNAILVNRDMLYQEIDDSLKNNKKIKVEIPIIEIENDIDVEALKNSVVKRGEFSTSYETSSAARKHNIKRALEKFNGLIVEPEQVISFNETTGERSEANGYKNAKMIVGGVYVDGAGGGVCQASTTLYNALLLSDLQVLTVNRHSLPAPYVPLSFDSMVSSGYSDLVFKNNTENPIYIKTVAGEKNVKVEIYGQKFDEGVSVSTRAELVKVLPHNGDKIVADVKGEYDNKILYKGEYHRVKYPKEGYESKGYVQYFKDGKLIEEKEVRHDFYQPQDGVVMEGVEEPADGMIIPASDVKIIKPQKVSNKSEEAIRKKLEKNNPIEYNP